MGHASNITRFCTVGVFGLILGCLQGCIGQAECFNFFLQESTLRIRFFLCQFSAFADEHDPPAADRNHQEHHDEDFCENKRECVARKDIFRDVLNQGDGHHGG